MTTCRAALILAAIAAGCAKSPEQKAEQAKETIASWHATVAAIDSARARGEVPDHFAREVRQAASREIEKAAAQVAK
jgi:hypothetical protein